MKFIDIVIPVLGFLTLFASLLPFKKAKTGRYVIILAIGIFVMGFTMFQSSESTDDMNSLSSNVITLLDQRKNDSISNVAFQKYLRDSFGIERKGNLPVKITYNTTNYFSQPNNPDEISDSENVDARLENSTLYLSPKKGSWVKPFFATDTSNIPKNQNIVEEGMGPMHPREKVVINGKTYMVGTYLIYERAVYKQKPLVLDLSGNINQYIIFGEQGNLTKRYLYKQGKVSWIPEM